MWGTLLSAGADLLGGFLTNKSNADSVSSANAANAAEAQKNRDFQLMMSNTAHQREVADLRAAGLNPILSATRGAPMASGDMAVSQPVRNENYIGKSVSTAIDSMRLKKETSIADAQIKNLSLEAAAKAAQLPAIQAQSVLDAKRAEIDTKMAMWDAIGSRGGKILSSAAGAAGSFFGGGIISRMLGIGSNSARASSGGYRSGSYFGSPRLYNVSRSVED